MAERPAARSKGNTADAPRASLETKFLLSVFAELSGRPRPPMHNDTGPSTRCPPAPEGAPTGT